MIQHGVEFIGFTYVVFIIAVEIWTVIFLLPYSFSTWYTEHFETLSLFVKLFPYRVGKLQPFLRLYSGF